jgi:hypothetical protein
MKFFLPCLFIFISSAIFCQNSQAISDSITGTWKGTSICQVKPSGCHDEIAVYHISASNKPAIFHVNGCRVVNGAEVSMGELDFSYTKTTGVLFHRDEERDMDITLTVKNNHIEGTLVSKGILERVIRLSKVPD